MGKIVHIIAASFVLVGAMIVEMIQVHRGTDRLSTLRPHRKKKTGKIK